MTTTMQLLGGFAATFLIIYVVWNATTPRFQVSFNDKLSFAERDGVVWVKLKGGRFAKKPFKVDNRQLFERPSKRTMQALVDQVEQMGYTIHSLEVLTPRACYAYHVKASVAYLTHRQTSYA